MKPESISAKEFIDEQVKIANSRGSKYRNKKVVIDGITFASIKEGNRYKELKLMEKAGEIEGLQLQKKFYLDLVHVNDNYKSSDSHICDYIADFFYWIPKRNGIHERAVEDVKSPITRKNPAYRIKKKLMKAIFGIDILET